MYGLGDCIYSRAFVKTLSKIYQVRLQTTWPEIFSDLNVEFIKPETSLRTQAKNVQKQNIQWVKDSPNVRCGYATNHLVRHNMFYGLEVAYDCKPSKLDLPYYPCPIPSGKKICVVRPATVRKEWIAESRNPLPEYICMASEIAMQNYHVVVVADLEAGHEWIIGDMPKAHQYFVNGELNAEQLLGLIQHSALVIGGVGWIVPAAIAANVNLFCILGGQGGYNAPERITDKSMDLTKVKFVKPDKYCVCIDRSHECNKFISNFELIANDYINNC
jgi:hypothetical protein